MCYCGATFVTIIGILVSANRLSVYELCLESIASTYDGQNSAAVVSDPRVNDKGPYCGTQDVNSVTVV